MGNVRNVKSASLWMNWEEIMGSKAMTLRTWIAHKILGLKSNESIMIFVGGIEGKRKREEIALKFLKMGW